MTEAVPFIGVSRHRMHVDGVGVTTLAAFHGCPLHCKYCLNPSCSGPVEGLLHYTPEMLYRKVGVDNLYFIATHGGVCFGGGEPLLHVDFIEDFRGFCGRSWALTAETSLYVSQEAMIRAAAVIDDFIVDVKDVNPEIYHAYTGKDNALVKENLRLLLSKVGSEHVVVRVPSIPEYNTPADTEHSVAWLKDAGFTQIDRFDYIVR